MQIYYLYAEVLACVLVFAVVHFALMRSDPHAYTSQHADESAGAQFLDAFYFSLVTQSTVGYGSIVPRSTPAKIAAGVQILTTLFFVVRWAMVHRVVK